MIINYFAIVNLSAQIENFTTQNTKCLAKNILRIKLDNTMCLTYNTCIVYLDKKFIYNLFLFMFSAKLLKVFQSGNNNSFVVNITRCLVYSKFTQIH